MSILNKIMGKFFKSKSDRDIKELEPLVEKINEEFKALQSLSNDELRAKTISFKEAIQTAIEAESKEIEDLKVKVELEEDVDAKETLYNRIDELKKISYEKSEEILEQILPAAFAVIKETGRRFTEQEEVVVNATQLDKDLAIDKDHVRIEGDNAIWNTTWEAGGSQVKWNMIHFDVQLMGGMTLHNGKVAEMMTGEGKTLVATLPVYINALTGNGVHLVTVNDYLAKRDSDWMAPLFMFHGLTVDCIDHHQPNSPERKKAYAADITYGTNNEFGFDYLRDNMARNPEDLVQREPNYAIVDEVDSVLIDDARTPLIISGPVPKGDNQQFDLLKPQVEALFAAQKKLLTTEFAEAKRLIKEGDAKEGGIKLFRSFRGLPKSKPLIKFLSEDGMKTLLQKTENFHMQDQNKEMHVIDEDLFFTIDEKQNSIELTDKGYGLLSKFVEDENFFILPDIATELVKLEGSEDANILQQKDALLRDFSIKSERIHTMNQLLKAYTLFEMDVEYVVMDNKVKIVDEQTGRIMDGRRYSDGLHQAIEAKENVKIEAATQTFATVTLQNYFRMYKKLSGMTGTAETEAKELWDIYELDVVVVPTNRPIQRNDEEDKIYKTKREKYSAVVDEIEVLTKAGRPVLVGTTSVEISELLGRYLKMKGINHDVLNAKQHAREADIVANAGAPGQVTIATNMAGRGTDIKISEEVKAAGGLAIIGTERHDSRRVDRQLRGRAGRQGDPGSSQFFVSLEDNLMRLFGSERIAKMMDKMGLEEGEVIQHSMISKSIEKAQKKVEENNFGMRKRLLEFDDAINSQREVIYKRRKHALFGERLSVDIANTFYDTCAIVLGDYQPAGDFEGFKMELIRFFAMESPFTEEEFTSGKINDLTDKLYEAVKKHYSEKSEFVRQQAFPVVKHVFEDPEAKFENMVIPFTDGQKGMQVAVNLQESYNTEGKNIVKSMEKSITLAIIDEAWKDHLREMDSLKSSVQNATYEQKDPLLIYKIESFNLFKVMLEKVNKDMISFLSKASIPVQQNPEQATQRPAQQPQEIKKAAPARQIIPPRPIMAAPTGGQWVSTSSGGDQLTTNRGESAKPNPAKAQKIGRNDMCPCGSGKKFKQCHGKDA